MYLDMDAGVNLAEPAMATFRETGPALPVQRLRLWLDGAWCWCALCRWADDAEQPAGPAWLRPIEESGDGPALLVYGDSQGLRLARVPDADAADPGWDLDDAEQWSEPFLICRPGTEYR